MASSPKRRPPGLRRLSLQNGLDVVLSPETSSPRVAVGMYYRAGFRLEPEGRTGCAQLFERLMFQGTSRVSKADFGQLINGAGGVLNGTTRHDYTNYCEVLPASALEMAFFLEADRMRNLDLDPYRVSNKPRSRPTGACVTVLGWSSGQLEGPASPERPLPTAV